MSTNVKPKIIFDLDTMTEMRYSSYMSAQPLAGDLSLIDVERANDEYGAWLSAQRHKEERKEICARMSVRQRKAVRILHIITLIIAGLAFAYSVLFDASVWYQAIFFSIALYLTIDLSTP